MLNKTISLILTILTFPIICQAASDTGADFLKLGVGARASAMGEAFCAVADSVDSIYYNPAGLARLKQKEVSAMYGDKREDTARTLLTYCQPLEDEDEAGVFACGIIYQDLGEIETRNNQNQFTGNLNPNEFALLFAYARPYTDNLSIGGNLKYIQRDLKKVKAKGFALDLGVLYYPQLPDLTLGACLENLGTKIEGDELPLNLRVGLAYCPIENLTGTIDLNQPLYNSKLGTNVGLEYTYNILAVRIGYLNKGREVSGLTYGFGFKVIAAGFSLRTDFANVASGKMDGATKMNRVSMGIKF
ncbi:MAG: PorV/PorQ family protein [bacterium]